MDDLSARINELETRLAFQDDTVHSLSDMVARQDQQMRQLQRQVELLMQRLRDQQQPYTEVVDQPPHY